MDEKNEKRLAFEKYVLKETFGEALNDAWNECVLITNCTGAPVEHVVTLKVRLSVERPLNKGGQALTSAEILNIEGL